MRIMSSSKIPTTMPTIMPVFDLDLPRVPATEVSPPTGDSVEVGNASDDDWVVLWKSVSHAHFVVVYIDPPYGLLSSCVGENTTDRQSVTLLIHAAESHTPVR